MSRFKKGDKIKFTSLGLDDMAYFEKNKLYIVDRVDRDMFDDLYIVYLEGIDDMFAWDEQIKLVIEDNALNRMLYPEYKPVDGYLEKEDV